MILVFLLMIVGISLGVCPSGLKVSLDLSAETVEKKGREFRRADILIFIPVDRSTLRRDFALRKETAVTPVDSNLYEVKVRLRNVSDRVVEGAYLEQRVGERSSPPDSINALRILSRTPFIFEPVELYPTDIREGRLVVKLPPLKPSEEIELSYLVASETTPETPEVRGTPRLEEEKRERVYMLVAKYSVLFGYGKTKTRDMNLENIKEVLRGFKEAGLKPIVKVVGMADGKTTNPRRNAEVADRRARFVAQKILGENYACYMRRGFAENIR